MHFLLIKVSDSPLELTPLGEAVRWGHLDIIKYLIMEYNMDVKGKLIIMCIIMKNILTLY